MTRAWDKENIGVPDRNRINDLLNTWRALYPLRYENSWSARLLNWVHMWQASRILLGSALSNSSWVVISKRRWRILSSVMKCERWIIQHDTSVRQRKYLSPWQESNPWPVHHFLKSKILYEGSSNLGFIRLVIFENTCNLSYAHCTCLKAWPILRGFFFQKAWQILTECFFFQKAWPILKGFF